MNNNRRVQVRDLQDAPDLKTFARQVDTYYRPEQNNVAKPGENNLMKLADALKEVEPRLQGYLTKEFDRAATDESAQGKQAFKEALLKDRDLNQRSFKDLVDGGVIPAGASPWFQKGWREQQLRLLADDFQREALMEWGQDGDVKNSNDPTKVREFLDGKRKTFMDGLKTSDRGFTSNEIADVLMPALEQADQRVSGAHVSHRLQAIEEEVVTRMYKTPETFDINEVASQVGKKLDTPRFMAILGDLGRAREAAKHPLMTYLPVKTLADDLAKGVAGSNGTVPGAGSANAGVAQSAFLRWQIEYLAANPKTSASGFHDEAMKVYDKLLRTYGNGQTLNMGAGQAYGLKKFAPVAVEGAQQATPQPTQATRRMPLGQAIEVLRKNPTPQVMRSFDESYPGHKADDYLK